MITLQAEKEHERIYCVAHLLHQATKPIKILRGIGWSQQAKADFFAKNARELPQVTYPSFDLQPTLELLEQARVEAFFKLKCFNNLMGCPSLVDNRTELRRILPLLKGGLIFTFRYNEIKQQ